jgi:tetratricopeptide (TPR) repeat protein
VTNYAGKTERETIEYGEKALALGGLDDLNKCNVLLTVSAVYSQRSQNLEKAKNYASQVVQIAKTNKTKASTEATPEQWNKFIGAAYFTHGQALEKSKYLKEAVDSYINSYNILKNSQIAISLRKLGKSLYDIRFYRDAEKALEIPISVLKDFASYAIYAKILYKNKKKEEALKYFKLAYGKQKSGEMAFYVGIILADKVKSNPSVPQSPKKRSVTCSMPASSLLQIQKKPWDWPKAFSSLQLKTENTTRTSKSSNGEAKLWKTLPTNSTKSSEKRTKRT